MFSKELEISIASLFDQAQEANIQYITVEHLLLTILNDYDVKDCLESSDIHIETFKQDLNDQLKKTSISKTDNKKPVQPTLGFQRVLQRAVFHIQSSGKGVVKPINILVAIYTPMEFVIYVLELIFHHNHEEATRIMMTVHTKGKGVCGIFSKEIAEMKSYEVNSLAKDHNHPLLSEIEPLKD